jgi:hypothetical protein
MIAVGTSKPTSSRVIRRHLFQYTMTLASFDKMYLCLAPRHRVASAAMRATACAAEPCYDAAAKGHRQAGGDWSSFFGALSRQHETHSIQLFFVSPKCVAWSTAGSPEARAPNRAAASSCLRLPGRQHCSVGQKNPFPAPSPKTSGKPRKIFRPRGLEA